MPATARKLPATLLLAALLLAVALAGAGAARAAEAGAPDVGATPAPAGSEAPPPPAAVPVEVAINPLAPGRAVPARFLGLSFEAQAIEQLGALGAHGDLVRLLRSLGPGVLRLGGITADQNVGWADSVTPRPPWATNVIGPAQMRAIGSLAHRSGWQVLLTVGMAHYEPQSAAREVAAAHAALGPYLAAVEIGNEPDAYGRHGFRQMPVGRAELRGTGRRLPRSDRRTDPGVAIAGPGRVRLGGVLGMGVRRGALAGAGDADRPPLSARLRRRCRRRASKRCSAPRRADARRSRWKRTSRSRDRGASRSASTRRTRCPAEASPGSATHSPRRCGPRPISARAMAAGTVGINLQGNPTNCGGYTPLCAPDPGALAAGQMRAQPDWYALLLTRSLVGYRPCRRRSPRASSRTSPPTASTGPAHTRKLLLVDEEAPGAAPLALRVPVGAGLGAARVLRLTGPSLTATGGVPPRRPRGLRRRQAGCHPSTAKTRSYAAACCR